VATATAGSNQDKEVGANCTDHQPTIKETAQVFNVSEDQVERAKAVKKVDRQRTKRPKLAILKRGTNPTGVV
jgi:hypothetical protein